MQQKEEKYQRLIVKSLSKEISDSEQAELQDWLSQHPENVALGRAIGFLALCKGLAFQGLPGFGKLEPHDYLVSPPFTGHAF